MFAAHLGNTMGGILIDGEVNVQALNKMFEQFDSDGNNEVDVQELKLALVAMSVTMQDTEITDGDVEVWLKEFDKDGDGDLWETTDTFDLDKIKIYDDSEDYFVQDSDATGDYYFKVTPVTYSGGSWSVETSNTVNGGKHHRLQRMA